MRIGGMVWATISEAIMRTESICIARIYLTEANHQLEKIIQYLHNNEKIAGATVFRGIESYGESGKMHQSTLLDLSFDLPITIEFFDQPGHVLEAIEHLKNNFNVEHIISWSAEQHH